jgi:hypothetical protein
MKTTRYFRAAQPLTLPQSLIAGPGATHLQIAPGDVVAFDGERCARELRFVNGRTRAGDLVEITAKEYDDAIASTEVAPVEAPEPAAPAKAAKAKG